MGTERQLPILYVVQLGTPYFERFMITNQKDEFWNGEQFTTTNTSLYAKHNDAATDVHNILKSQFEGVEPVRYVMPLIVEVYSDKPPQVSPVIEYLSKATRLHINITEHGNGPGSSLVLPWIDWNQIKGGSMNDDLPNLTVLNVFDDLSSLIGCGASGMVVGSQLSDHDGSFDPFERGMRLRLIAIAHERLADSHQPLGGPLRTGIAENLRDIIRRK